MNEEILKSYEELKRNRNIINTIEPDFFFEIVDCLLKENETYKKQYFCLIDKIENKIDKFDYEFEKAKRKSYQERADYYWDLIRNFKKLLEEE